MKVSGPRLSAYARRTGVDFTATPVRHRVVSASASRRAYQEASWGAEGLQHRNYAGLLGQTNAHLSPIHSGGAATIALRLRH